MDFYKMHGAGNDFIFIKDFNFEIIEECEIAKKICDRHYGIGADGLVIVRKSGIADSKMVIINSDGSRANMCGNAIRCFGKYVYENGIINKTNFSVETGDGVKNIELIIENDKVKYVKVFMGNPSYDGKDIPLNFDGNIIDSNIEIDNKSYRITTLLMGVPHTVVFDDNDEYEVHEDGAAIEKFNLFKEGTNVNFVKIVDRNHITVNTWERGAGATLACGTGCSASVVVAKKLGLVDKNAEIIVKAPGGELIIDLVGNDVYMKGPAEFVFEGKINL